MARTSDRHPALDTGTDRDAPPPAPSHGQLLTITRAVRRAVVEDDHEQLVAALAQLHESLARHLRSERDATSALPAMDRLIAADGQRRLLALVAELLAAAPDDTGDCPCVVRAAELDVALQRQFLLEARLLEGRAPRRRRRRRSSSPR